MKPDHVEATLTEIAIPATLEGRHHYVAKTYHRCVLQIAYSLCGHKILIRTKFQIRM
jgi:hypothetical protein